MIIGTCGFGSSGSSVITDYLKEYNIFTILDDVEFTIPYVADGLQQLDFIISNCPSRNDSSYVAIERFERLMKNLFGKGGFVKNTSVSKERLLKITDDFIQSITLCQWNGYNGTEVITKNKLYRLFGISLMMQRIIPFYEKKTGKIWDGFPYHNIRLISGANFEREARKFIKNILNEMSCGGQNSIVLDQPFPGDDPISCMKYFDNPKAIVVDRDPRDMYIFLKTKLKSRGKFMPSNSVENFVSYYREIRRMKKYMIEDQRLLYIKFEDMVYEYSATSKKVQAFLGLSSNPNPKSIFVPEMSMANTQLFTRFLQFENDIKYIERELPEYLYDFSKYPKPDANSKMFFGKSPLNTSSRTVHKK